jgi:hypothetical protein
MLNMNGLIFRIAGIAMDLLTLPWPELVSGSDFKNE